MMHLRSHHPTHLKRGKVRCLYNHARCIAKQGQNLEEEEEHLMKASMRNGYQHFICSAQAIARAPREDNWEGEEERPLTVYLPYVAGISERMYKDFNNRAVFKSRPTLLTKVKYHLSMEKQSNSMKYRASAERCTSAK